MKFTVKKQVVLPQLKLVVGNEYFFKPTSEMYIGKKIEDDKDPATLMNGVNLETGEECLIVVPTVLASVLREAYEERDDSYVGKCFRFELVKVNGKKYHQVKVEEIEVQS